MLSGDPVFTFSLSEGDLPLKLRHCMQLTRNIHQEKWLFGQKQTCMLNRSTHTSVDMGVRRMFSRVGDSGEISFYQHRN